MTHEEIVQGLKDWPWLRIGKDDGERMEYERLSDEDYDDIARNILLFTTSIGDEILITDEKATRITKGKKYKVFRKDQIDGHETIYWFYNDRNQPQTAYEGEFKKA